MNLKKQFFIFVILMIFIPLAIIGWSSYYYRTRFYVEKEKTNINDNVSVMKNNLKIFSGEVESLLLFLSKENNLESQEQFKTTMKNLISEKKEFGLVYYGLEDTGEFFGVSRDLTVSNRNPKDNSLPKDYDPRNRPWYLGAKEKQKFHISEVYHDVLTKKSIATFSLPMFKDDKFYGVLAFDIDLKEFSKRLNMEGFNENDLSVLDNNGHVIISANEKELGRTNEYFSNLTKVNGEFSVKKENKIYIYQFIENLGFYVLVEINENNILKEFEPLRNLSLLIAGISILVSVIIVLIFIGLLEKFLFRLSLTLDNISEGNYRNEFKEFEMLIGNNRDFSSIKKALEKMQERVRMREQSLEKLANFDMLTLVYNRRHLFSVLNEEFEKARILDMNFSIAILDLDNFKLINDNYGHHTGDEVLKNVVTEIQKHLRTKDVLGRYGGEEFMIVFPDSSLDEVIVILEKAREGIEAMEWEISSLKVTTSIGVTNYKNQTLEKMIQEADYYLYEAKHQGKNRIESARHSEKNSL